jgi:uncharacterized protein YbjT (DUF2867 family)
MSETETTGSPEQKQEWLAEQMLRWSGLPVVYLRPTVFFDGMFLVQGAKGIRDDNANVPSRSKTSAVSTRCAMATPFPPTVLRNPCNLR